MMNPQRPSDHPNWSQDVTTAIDNIFEHLLELARSLEALETRIAALEAATPAPQEEPQP